MFILVPALLGLKGNLEMTLASRLSTAVRPLCVLLLLKIILKVSTVQSKDSCVFFFLAIGLQKAPQV